MSIINKDNLQNVDEIHDTLIKRIKDDGSILHISLKFSALQTNAERVRFIIDLMEKYKVNVTFNKVAKNDNKSEILRNLGNDYYRKKLYDSALRFYNESLTTALQDTKNFALAYGNRSAVLFQLKQYAASLEDIKKAEEANYPQESLSKLLDRKKKCETYLNNVQININECYKTDPLLKGNNTEIPCASAVISLDYDINLGRRIIAKEDITPGSVLVEEPPFVSSLLSDLRYSRCSNCLRKSYNLIPCSGCTETMFCNSKCMETGINKCHVLECAMSSSLKTLALTKIQYLSFRVAIRALTYYNADIKALRNAIDVIDKYSDNNTRNAGFCKDSHGNLTYQSDVYDPIHCLVSHSENRKTADLFYRAVVAAVLVKIFQYHTNVGKCFNDNDAEFFGGVILHHLQTSACNMHTISELADNSCEDMQLGNGAFAIHSLFNHSCVPNVTRYTFYVNGEIVMKTIALLPINKGSEIFDNYGHHFAISSKEERIAELKEQYFFTCQCVACTKNYPLYSELPLLTQYPPMTISKEAYKKLKKHCKDFAQKNLNIYTKQLEKVYCLLPYPNKQLCDLQEAVKQCLAILSKVN